MLAGAYVLLDRLFFWFAWNGPPKTVGEIVPDRHRAPQVLVMFSLPTHRWGVLNGVTHTLVSSICRLLLILWICDSTWFAAPWSGCSFGLLSNPHQTCALEQLEKSWSGAKAVHSEQDKAAFDILADASTWVAAGSFLFWSRGYAQRKESKLQSLRSHSFRSASLENAQKAPKIFSWSYND